MDELIRESAVSLDVVALELLEKIQRDFDDEFLLMGIKSFVQFLAFSEDAVLLGVRITGLSALGKFRVSHR